VNQMKDPLPKIGVILVPSSNTGYFIVALYFTDWWQCGNCYRLSTRRSATNYTHRKALKLKDMAFRRKQTEVNFIWEQTTSKVLNEVNLTC
jgi:hypothetical protein